MVTKQKKSQPLIEKVFKLSLWQPYNTPLHRTGLAGLYMSLEHLKSFRGEVLDWDLSTESITLRWNCSDREALSWLLSNTYKLSNNDSLQGMIIIPCLGSINTDTKVTIHNGILHTFLQHPSAVDSDGIKKCALQLDENQTLEVNYKALNRYNHQDLKSLAKTGLYDKQDNFLPYIRIAQWLYPGATEKHVAITGGKTRLQESPEGFISLLFAPIACSYYQVRSRLKASKYRWALIIPNIDNLQEFAEIRLTDGFQVVSYKKYFASGLSDASLAYLLTLAGQDTITLQKTLSCHILALGDVPWSQQQSITKHQSVCINSERIKKIYSICDSKLSQGIKVGKNGVYIDVSFGREVATENLIEGKAWYSRFHDILKFNSEVFNNFFYERGSLEDMKEAMISHQLTNEIATLFSDAFTWQFYEQRKNLNRNTSSGKTNYDKLNTDMLMAIRNCRSQSDFVRLQISVFSRPTAVQNPFLEGIELGEFYLWSKHNWQDCLALMTLAIVSYKNPWLNPRTLSILLIKGRKKPKYLEDKADNTNTSSTSEFGTSDKISFVIDNAENSDEDANGDDYEETDLDSVEY